MNGIFLKVNEDIVFVRLEVYVKSLVGDIFIDKLWG